MRYRRRPGEAFHVDRRALALVFSCLFLTLLLTVSPHYRTTAAAQEAATEETATYVLDEIVVTGSIVPQHLSEIGQSLSVIGREELEALPAGNIPDALRMVSGVDVRQRGVQGLQADVSVRGSSYEQTLILVDGVNVSDPQTGHHNMDLPVNMGDIERIEILKGPGARVYGHNAMAGVVNIITRNTGESAVGGRLKFGDFGFYSLDGHVTGRTGPLSHRISLAGSASTGHIENKDTDFDTVTLAYGSALRGENHRVQLGLGYTQKDFGAYKFYSDTFPNQRERTQSSLVYANADFEVAGVEIIPRAFWRRHEDDFRIEIGGTWYQNSHTTDSYGLQVGSRYESTLGTLAVGGEIAVEDLQSTNLGDHDRQRHGIFLEHRLRPTDGIVVGIGASAMNYSDWDWEYWPGADMSIRLPAGFRLFASAARSFRAPTYTELYYDTPANRGNPDLVPERAWTYETGLRRFQGRMRANLSLFYRDAEDVIDWSRASTEEPWKVRNIASIRTRGFEAGIEFSPSLDFGHAQDTILSLSYTYLDSDKSAAGLESKYVLDHLRHQLNGTLFIGWSGALSQSVQARYGERLNGDSYFVLDSRLAYQWYQYALFLDITNILDEEYVEAGFAPAAGRWIVGGIKFNFDL